MSRISAPGIIVASSALAGVALCALGLVAAGSPASAKPENTRLAAHSPLLRSSAAIVDNRLVMSGSHRGVWFDLPDAFGAAAVQAGLLPGLVGASAASSAPERSQPTAAQPAKPAPPSPTPAPTATPTPAHQQSRSSALSAVSGNPRDIAEALASTRGWTGSQWVCLDTLWEHESRYQTTVRNATSGAYGIPQALPASKMATAGSDWRTNPVTQIQWGLGYIGDRYGSPCGAWSYWTRHYSY